MSSENNIKNISDYIKDKNSQEKQNHTHTSKSSERIVWGVSIKEGSSIKDLSEVFVKKNFEFYASIGFKENMKEKQKAIRLREDFLASYKDELLPNENVEEMLKEAWVIVQEKMFTYVNKANGIKNNKLTNEDILNNNEMRYADYSSRLILDSYSRTKGAIESLISKEQDCMAQE